jgi:hypothetical protein
MTQEITLAEYRALAPRRNKYSAQKTTVDGIVFASKREVRRYGELRQMVAAGEIRDLELQPRFLLQEGFTDNEGVKHRAISYVGDFDYIEVATGRRVVEDSKGKATREFSIKWKLVKRRYPDVVFRLV